MAGDEPTRRLTRESSGGLVGHSRVVGGAERGALEASTDVLPIDCPGSSWICFADQCWRMRLATGYRCRDIEEPAAAAVTCKCLGAYRQFLGMATPIKVGLLRQSIASASGPSAAEHCCLGLASLFEPLREPLRSSCSLV